MLFCNRAVAEPVLIRHFVSYLICVPYLCSSYAVVLDFGIPKNASQSLLCSARALLKAVRTNVALHLGAVCARFSRSVKVLIVELDPHFL